MGRSAGPAPMFGVRRAPWAPARPVPADLRPRAALPAGMGALGPGTPKSRGPGAGEGARAPSLPSSSASRADFLEGERDINQEIKKKKFLHIFKTHVALSEVLFILTKSGGTCPRSGEADGAINHGRRGCLRCPRRSCHSFCLRF